MKKLTFERAVLVVFIAIILISTSEITGKYIAKLRYQFFNGYKTSSVNPNVGRSMGFSSMLINADNLFRSGEYAKAADSYFTMTLNNTLTLEQKVHALFNLGVCQYKLGKYDLALDSFNKVVSFNPNDSVAYNNAAVSAYRDNNIEKAIELQKSALNILPAVEYYYNLARMYEDNEQYELAAKYYFFVAKGEQNITEVDRIDPVRIKEKIARLQPKTIEINDGSKNNIIMAWKLKDTRDILTLNDNEMQIKQSGFNIRVDKQKDSKIIIAQYDKKKNDPYNLITELAWTVYKDGKLIYKKISDKISLNASEPGNYTVQLKVKNSSNKEIIYRKAIMLYSDNSSIGNTIQDNVPVNKPTRVNTKIYLYALYEQLFESDFVISQNGYTDKYNVIWGKDDVDAYLDKTSRIDRISSLTIENTSDIDKGLWVNLDSLLKDKELNGKTLKIGFYARKITTNAKVNLIVRVKSQERIAITQDILYLDSRWDQKNSLIFIPENATGLTISIMTAPGEKFGIDGFTVMEK